MEEDTLDETFDQLGDAVKDIENKIDTLTQAHRESAVRRFPILFTLLSTFGVAAVFFGFERLLGDISVLDRNPLLILLIGILVLILTGTLYKKL